jgi:hypothetical protein
MTDHAQDRAQSVVDKFKEILSPEARGNISDAEFTELVALIRAAIAVELNASADLVDEVVKKLRATTDKPELAL